MDQIMKKYLRIWIYLIVGILTITMPLFIEAQKIQEPSTSSFGDPHDFVDPLLANEEAAVKIRFTENHDFTGSEAKILYSKLLSKPEPKQQYGWAGLITATGVIRGKKASFQVYESPYVYYGILDFPQGRFYGLFTTGFDNLYDAVHNDISTLHPLGDIRIMGGTLVKPSGEKIELVGVTPDKLNDKVSKPSGTYHYRNFMGYDNLDFTFNQGGTGKATFEDSYRRQAVPTLNNMAVERNQSGRAKKTRRQIGGGYDFYVNTTIGQNFKWSIKDDGVIDINFTGKPTITVQCKVDESTEFANMVISESDRRIEMQRHRQDIHTNKDAVREKKLATERAKEKFSETRGTGLSTHLMIKDRIITRHLDKNTALPYYSMALKKKYDNTDRWFDDVLTDMQRYIQSFAKNREYGALKLFPTIKKKLTNAISSSSYSPLSSASDYYVYELSPDGLSGKIKFVSSGKKFDADFTLDADFNISQSNLSSIKEDLTILEKDAEIQRNNSIILDFQKDKKRKKIVQEYQKETKHTFPLYLGYTTLDEFEKINEQQDQLLKIQTRYRNELE